MEVKIQIQDALVAEGYSFLHLCLSIKTRFILIRIPFIIFKWSHHHLCLLYWWKTIKLIEIIKTLFQTFTVFKNKDTTNQNIITKHLKLMAKTGKWILNIRVYLGRRICVVVVCGNPLQQWVELFRQFVCCSQRRTQVVVYGLDWM